MAIMHLLERISHPVVTGVTSFRKLQNYSKMVPSVRRFQWKKHRGWSCAAVCTDASNNEKLVVWSFLSQQSVLMGFFFCCITQ
ncbi:B-cell receptor [Dirofilaria immitis]